MTISLTEREILMVLDVCTDYISMIGEAEVKETRDSIEYMLDTGLGSAIRKLAKGRNYIGYAQYKTKRKYPSYDEWIENRENEA